MPRRKRSVMVAAELRERIVTGEFQPGSQLPTWDMLGKQYTVGRNVLVRAIAHLKHQQFIYSASTRGTFVVDRPPHLHHYALLFHEQPGVDRWNQFWSALTDHAAEIETLRGCRIVIRHGVRNETGNEAQRQLLEEIETDQYAGLIYVSNPDRICPQALQRPGLPQVVIMDKSDQAQVSRVDIDRASFVSKTIDWLRARGHKKVALLSSYSTSIHELLRRGIQDAGFELRPEWILSAAADYPATAEPIVRLLLCGAQPELPDALVVSNDNLVDAALAAVVAMGKRVPEELEILTHCNWPTRKGHIVPTSRLGYDVRQILQECIKIIDACRAGTKTAKSVQIPALFENEIESSHRPENR